VQAKQFLKLLPGMDGLSESMLQRVSRQINEVGMKFPWSSITVVATEAQKEQLQIQLGDNIDIVTELARKDTFISIALACLYLFEKKGIGKDESIAVLPVDSFVDTEFFERVAQIENELNKTQANIILLGAKPTFPSEKYGYIVPEKAQDEDIDLISNEVLHFKEKPTAIEAEALIENGALWNCGVFGFHMGYILDIIRKELGADSYEIMRANFASFYKRSFDYEVVEKASRIRVIEYSGKWKDIGTWETFSEEIYTSVIGKSFADELSANTTVLNTLSIPVVVMGIEDSVVVASYDGILVAAKGETSKLKEATAMIDNRPMQEERRWGSYIVLQHEKSGDVESLTKKLSLDAGKKFSYQYHNHRKEIWTILSGQGILIVDGKKREVNPGDAITIAEKEHHALYAKTDLELIEVQIGKPLIEEDIVGLDEDWCVKDGAV
jgi:mannose-1-phosphate guanylyltransferase